MWEYLKLLYYLWRPKVIFLMRTSHGMGDNLLLTILLPGIRSKNPEKKIVVETPWKELFEHNPYVDWVTDKHFKTTKRHIKPKYYVDSNTTISLYEQMMGYIGETEKRFPRLYLTDREKQKIKERFPFPYITICPHGKTTFCANRKEWGFENFQKLRNLLPEYKFVQIGVPSDPLLENVLDARDLSIRDSASAIYNSLFFVGLEGGLMHLSKAVGKKSIIIYGGFIRPEISAYSENINIYNQVWCSPCYNSNIPHKPCNTMICMKQISPEMILEKIQEHFLDKSELKECR